MDKDSEGSSLYMNGSIYFYYFDLGTEESLPIKLAEG